VAAMERRIINRENDGCLLNAILLAMVNEKFINGFKTTMEEAIQQKHLLIPNHVSLQVKFF
jgi:hypothetical protein